MMYVGYAIAKLRRQASIHPVISVSRIGLKRNGVHRGYPWSYLAGATLPHEGFWENDHSTTICFPVCFENITHLEKPCSRHQCEYSNWMTGFSWHLIWKWREGDRMRRRRWRGQTFVLDTARRESKVFGVPPTDPIPSWCPLFSHILEPSPYFYRRCWWKPCNVQHLLAFTQFCRRSVNVHPLSLPFLNRFFRAFVGVLKNCTGSKKAWFLVSHLLTGSDWASGMALAVATTVKDNGSP